MANRITLDFENEMITWDKNSQKGSESCPGLAEKESVILELLGYDVVDFSPAVDAFNAFFSGKMTEAEFLKKIKEFEDEEL